jgi:hypothetical protein
MTLAPKVIACAIRSDTLPARRLISHGELNAGSPFSADGRQVPTTAPQQLMKPESSNVQPAAAYQNRLIVVSTVSSNPAKVPGLFDTHDPR